MCFQAGVLAALLGLFFAQPIYDLEHKTGPNGNARPKSTKESTSSVSIRWFGQSAFRVTTSGGTTFVIDPVNFKGYRMPEGTTGAIVTVSHEHMDHNAVETVSGTPLVLRGTDSNCEVVNAVDTTLGGVRIYTVPSYHDPGHHGRNAIFVFEFDGLRLVHLGDIGTVLTEEQIAAIGEVDILMIPVGGMYTIAAPGADSIVNQLHVRRLVFPMHYQTEAFEGLPYTAEPFLEGKKNVRRLDSSEIAIDPRERPAALEYVVLTY
jgi:L-ascorbate metabolism protein UlaG (beta-lactamase superfamily)